MPTSLNAIICAAMLSLLIGNGSVAAQVPPGDSASQRILPLPDGKLSNAETQMQLLQKLRSLVTASEEAERSQASTPDTPKINGQQLEQLQQALQKLQDQLPPGIEPPDLGSIPKEQLDEAISNPAVQQQLKKMLEQFSRDGLLPKSGDQNETPALPPLPRRRGESSTRPGSKRQPQPKGSSEESPPQPADKSWQSLKDAMKKLSQIAQGGNQKSHDDNDSRQNLNPDAEHDVPSDEEVGSPASPLNRTTPPNGRSSDESRLSENDQSDGNRTTDKPRQQSLQAFQDLLERYKNSQRNNPPDSENQSSGADELARRELGPGFPSLQSDSERRIPEQGPSNRVLRRSDRARPVEPQISPRSRMSESGEVFPPTGILSSDAQIGDANRANQRSEDRTEIGKEPDSSSDLIPSVSEFLKEQLRNGFPMPDGARSRKTEQGSNSDVNQPENKPGIGIRDELDRRGIRGTIEKLVQKAREESKAQQRVEQQRSVAGEAGVGEAGNPSLRSGNVASPNDQTKGTNAAGLQNSLKNLLGGLDDDMQDIIKDARFKNRDAELHRKNESPQQSASRDSESRLNKWNDAASEFLSDLSKAPQAPPSKQSPSVVGNSATADNPFAIASLLMAGLGLLGLLALIAFCIRRPLLKMVAGATGFAGSAIGRPPGEIRSRQDVITAFHELVLNPKQLVESWWTHRAAAQKLAAESPQQESAVRTLAEIYEQARYLPDDVELPAEKIESARTAYAECQKRMECSV